MGTLVSSDVTILNKYCDVTRASADTYSQSENVCGERKDHGFFSRHLSEFFIFAAPKPLGIAYCKIAYSSAVVWNRVRESAGFGWTQTKWKMRRARRRAAAVVSVADWFFLAVAKRGRTR